MDFGAHRPLMDFGGNPHTFDHLVGYTETAARLGFSALSVNDHMVFSVPWLDGELAGFSPPNVHAAADCAVQPEEPEPWVAG